MLKLSNKIAIYIPTTVNVDKKADTSKILNKVASLFSKINGGATIEKVKGAWLSSNKKLVLEDIYKVISYTADKEKSQKLAIRTAKAIKNMLKQEAVSIEIDGDFYLI